MCLIFYYGPRFLSEAEKPETILTEIEKIQAFRSDEDGRDGVVVTEPERALKQGHDERSKIASRSRETWFGPDRQDSLRRLVQKRRGRNTFVERAVDVSPRSYAYGRKHERHGD